MSSKRKEPRNKVTALQADWVSTSLTPLKGSSNTYQDFNPNSCESSLEGAHEYSEVCETFVRLPLADFMFVAEKKPGHLKKSLDDPGNEIEKFEQKDDQMSQSLEPPLSSIVGPNHKEEDIVAADDHRIGNAEHFTNFITPRSQKDAPKDGDGDVGKGTGKSRCAETSLAILKEASIKKVTSLAMSWKREREREPELLSQSQLILNLQEQEDEVLALQAIHEDKFRSLVKEEGKQSTYGIWVPVDVSGGLTVLVELPASDIPGQSDDTKEKTEQESDGEEDQHRLLASTRGRSQVSTPGMMHSFLLQHIPPLQLTFTFPEGYPSSSPPIFCLSSCWLSGPQLSSLCKALHHIWLENIGEVTVYSWTEWLHSHTLAHLGSSDKLFLGPYPQSLLKEQEIDDRAISGCSSPENDIPFLLCYNEDMRLEEFYQSWHMCSICFNEQCGKDFVKLPCQHFFCWTCMEQYSSVHVKEGSVNKLNCPDTTCRGSIPPFLLKELLEEDDFRRWEDLLLRKTLDSMIDVVYCPRCETVCIEDEDHHVQCGGCFFNFCSLCRAAWHVGQECMSAEARLRILQERQKGRTLGDEQRKKEQDLVNEVLNLKYVNREAKLCPTCKMAISKVEGCNKMTCTNCGQYFCFRCGCAIDGYDHFGSGSCVLFEQAEIEIWERQMNHRQLEAQARLELWPEFSKTCPNCRQRNAKEGNNNHIFCWACQNHYCGLCNKMVRRAAEHYGPNKCRQHTTD